MLAEIVFLSRFLGLVTGEQTVVLEPDAEVRSVALLLDDRRVSSIGAPPWSAKVDLGTELAPHELTAVGYDAAGAEVARGVQILNITRPRAELEILVDRDGDRVSVRLEWAHYRNEKPVRAEVRVDGQVVSTTPASKPVALPKLESAALHTASAEVEFADGVVAKNELVFGGIYSEQMPAELTAVAVRNKSTRRNPRPQPCTFRVGGHDVTPAAVEEGGALISFVLNGQASASVRRASAGKDPLFEIRGAEIRVVSPIAARAQQRTAEAAIFPSTKITGARSIRNVLMLRSAEAGTRRFADAVAVAALHSLGSMRRVVVFVMGSDAMPDQSANSVAIVRRYLERIGVPLRVWSSTGPRPDLVRVWGEIDDVSTPGKLLKATLDLRHELAAQRVAWIPATVLDALEAKTNQACEYEVLARAE